MSVDVSAAENRARAAIRELRRDELRARKAERIRQRRQADPELRAREAELKRKRRAANLEARARHAERIRQRRQADPELRAREAESKRKRREVNLAAVRQREAEWKRKRRAADCEAARQRESAAKRLEQLLQPGTDVASAPFERHFLDRSFGHSCSLCDRLWFDNDVTKVGSIQNEQHWNAVAGVLRQELGTASSNDGNHVACVLVVGLPGPSTLPALKVQFMLLSEEYC
nr:stress response protein NST1-like isoform X3 [Rhipicephalus microplus]